MPVRHVQSIFHVQSSFIPSDETCFHIFEAHSEADVRDAAARAGIQAQRVVETTTVARRDCVEASA
jgi:hypothetical protein